METEPAETLIIECGCGYVLRGEIEAEFLANARNHIAEAHPGENPSDEHLLELARQGPTPGWPP